MYFAFAEIISNRDCELFGFKSYQTLQYCTWHCDKLLNRWTDDNKLMMTKEVETFVRNQSIAAMSKHYSARWWLQTRPSARRRISQWRLYSWPIVCQRRCHGITSQQYP